MTFNPNTLYQYHGGAGGLFLLCGRCLEAARVDVTAHPDAYADSDPIPFGAWTVSEHGTEPNAADACDDCGLDALPREDAKP